MTSNALITTQTLSNIKPLYHIKKDDSSIIKLSCSLVSQISECN